MLASFLNRGSSHATSSEAVTEPLPPAVAPGAGKALTDLAPEVVQRILSYNNTTHLSLPLWLVGNEQLNQVLASCVVLVELRNAKTLDYVRLPKYLTQLTSLRHLIIDRCLGNKYGNVYDPPRTATVLSKLPQEMESLILRVNNAKLIFFPSEESSAHAVDLKAKFPRMTRLELECAPTWTYSELQALPQTLTDLHIGLDSNPKTIIESLEKLPPSISCLTITSPHAEPVLTPTFFQRLPPNMTSLTVLISSSDEVLPILDTSCFVGMPRNLTGVNVYHLNLFSPLRGKAAIEGPAPGGNCPFRWSSECGPNVPRDMYHLTIPSITEKDIAKALGALPEKLKSLDVGSIELGSSQVKALPRRLERLQLQIKSGSNIKESDFPPTLTELGLRAIKLKRNDLSLLRPLSSLTIHTSFKMKYISRLPPSLTHLALLQVSDLDVTVKFPPKLTHLACSGQGFLELKIGTGARPPIQNRRLTPFEQSQVIPPAKATIIKSFPLWSLPKTLQTLHTSAHIPASKLVHLPPLLRTLHVNTVFEDSEYLPENPNMIHVARLYLNEALEKDEYDFLLTKASKRPEVVVFDLMPRGIQDLSLYVLPLAVEAYSRLPKGLTRLNTISPYNKPTPQPNALLHIPKANLLELKFGADNISDSHMKVLQHIPFVTLDCTNFRMGFTFKTCVNYVPYYEGWPSWIEIGRSGTWLCWSVYIEEAMEAAADPTGKALKKFLANKDSY